MFAQTVPAFQDASRWMVHSTSSKAIADAAIQQGYVAADGYTALAEPGIYQLASANPDTTALFVVSLLALLANAAVFIYMILHIRKTKRNPYRTELYSDLASYQKIKTLAK